MSTKPGQLHRTAWRLEDEGERSAGNDPFTPVVSRSPKAVAPPYEYLEIDTIRVRYLIHGAGPWLLFLHGWGGRIENFTRLLTDFGARHTVCAFDFPGFGESSVPPSAWGVDDFVSLTRAVTGRLDVQHPDILAHSFGGRVAVKLSAEYPNEARRLILVGTPGVRRRRTARHQLRTGMARIAKVLGAYGGQPGRWFRDRVYGVVASKDYREAGPLKDTFVRVVNEDLRPWLPRIQAPTLLVWGEDDREVPPSIAHAMVRAIPNSSLEIIRRAGHFCFLDQPDYFRLLIAKFLR